MIQKVRDLAKLRNYSVNRSAANLRSGSSMTLGVIVPRINRDFFSNCIAGIEEIAKSAGYSVLISQSHDNILDESEIIKTMIEGNVSAVLISVAIKTSNVKHIEQLDKVGIPVVFFDRAMDDSKYCKVVIDDLKGAYLATKHLLDMGYKRIAHFAGDMNLMIYENRMAGYEKALKEYGVKIDPTIISTNTLTFENGQEQIKQFMQLKKAPDALFAASDFSALGALIYLKSIGTNIPKDFGVVGFSNETFTSFVSPNMSTVNQHSLDIGRNAAKVCLNILESPSKFNMINHVIIEPTLIVRESSQRIVLNNK
ncbi:MAG: LacI family DNA-binding transcriptional regulator [Saprospiraceae bacterium]|nr:LacI family DNA-binding transcriptional regulator [Saprospiraceae bacterium]